MRNPVAKLVLPLALSCAAHTPPREVSFTDQPAKVNERADRLLPDEKSEYVEGRG